MYHRFTKGILSGISCQLCNFRRDNRGSITQVFGMAAIPIFVAAGAAVDGARISQEQANFLAAVDTAVIAIAADDRSSLTGLTGTALSDRQTLLENLAQEFVEKNYSSDLPEGSEIEIDLVITGSDVTLNASLDVPTTLMSIVGIGQWELAAESQVKKAMRPIEIAIVMDTTGSMATDNKIGGAKTAAKQLLETLYGGSKTAEPDSEYIRVALVPFSGAVKLDKTAYDFDLTWIDTGGANTYSKLNLNAIGTTPSAWNNYYAWSQVMSSANVYHSWNGCVEARRNGSSTGNADYNINDIAPTITNVESLFPAYFNPDAYGSTVTENSYGISYIGGTSTSAVGSECKGLTSTVCSSTSTTNLRIKQENYQKYIGKNVGVESANPTSTTSSYYGPWGGCSVSKMVPMTYDRAKVEDGIDAMRAHGITVIPEGLAWGWRAISPTAPLTKVSASATIPASTLSPYGDAKWQKIIVLMTDGDNNVNSGSYTMNTTRYSAYGFGSEATANNRFGTTSSSLQDDALDTYTDNLCEKIKDEEITLYVASFGDDISTASKNMLKDCATSPDHYKHASSSADLQAFFDHIGEDVINKSIYVSK